MPIYKAQIDNFKDLLIEFIDNERSKDIIEHTYPNRNGAVLEDMGSRANHYRFAVYFKGENYETWEVFENYVLENRILTFIHPKRGMKKGRVQSVATHDEDMNRVARLELTFIEEAVTDSSPMESIDIVGSVENSFVQSQAEQMARFDASLRSQLGADADRVLLVDLNPLQKVSSQVKGLSAQSRRLIASIDSNLTIMDNTLTSIAIPASSVLNMVSFASTLPGRVVGSVAAIIDKYCTSLSALRSSPVQFIARLKENISLLKNSCSSLADALTFGLSSRVCVELATIYETDENVRNKMRVLEKNRGFDLNGNYIRSVLPAVVLTVENLEQSLYDARAIMQDAITIDRTQRAITTSALFLVKHVNKIKVEREYLQTVNIHSEMPLHIILNRQGLPYNYADRVCSVNKIRNPNFVSGKVAVYARQS